MEASRISRIIINGRFLSQPVSGVQRCAFEIASRLVAINPSVVVVVPPNVIHQQWATQLKAVTVGHRHGHLWEQRDLKKYLKKSGNPLLINLGNTAPLGYSNQAVLLHDVAFFAYPKHFSLPFRFFYKLMWFFLSRQIKQIVTVSNFSKNEIEHYLPASHGKVVVIHNGFNALPFTEDQLVKNYFLMVGNLDGRKNLNLAIKAFTQASLPGVILKIVGASSPIFSHKAEPYPPSIEFLGRKDDNELSALYCGAKALIYPSLYEGFGLPPLEAMSCGCPVIAADIDVLHEIAGDAALFIDPLSMESIKQAIITLNSDEQRVGHLRLQGFLQIKKFSWDKAAGQFNQLISSLATTRSR